MDRIKLLKEYLIGEPNDDFLNYALALEYQKHNKLDEAEKVFNEIILRNANYLPSYYQLGKTYETKMEFEKAKMIYQKGIEIAMMQKNMKTLQELKEALLTLDISD